MFLFLQLLSQSIFNFALFFTNSYGWSLVYIVPIIFTITWKWLKFSSVGVACAVFTCCHISYYWSGTCIIKYSLSVRKFKQTNKNPKRWEEWQYEQREVCSKLCRFIPLEEHVQALHSQDMVKGHRSVSQCGPQLMLGVLKEHVSLQSVTFLSSFQKH